MKLFAALLLSFGVHAQECKNKIPLSEAKLACSLAPSAGSKTCPELPSEPCVCFDNIVWEACEVALDGAGRETIRNKPEKLMEHRQREQENRLAKQQREERKRSAMKQFMEADISSVTTIKDLKQILKNLQEAQGD